jgi:hypothetical protein
LLSIFHTKDIGFLPHIYTDAVAAAAAFAVAVAVYCVQRYLIIGTTINQLSLHEEFMMPSPSRNNSARTTWCLMPMPYFYATTNAVAVAVANVVAVYRVQCHLIGD